MGHGGVAHTEPPVNPPLTVHIAGDSTAAVFSATDARVGWGAVFKDFLDASVTVNDRALSGRSTKSFIDEGAWASLVGGIRAGDYVMIGFGHNDEKAHDPTRYTDPATTFRDNLRRFVSETRAASGEPLLVTPICRRKYAGSAVIATHGAYPEAIEAVAAQTGTPLLDLTQRSREWLETLGPASSEAFFAPADQTHTSRDGARAIAGLVADELRRLRHPLTARLREPAPGN